MSQFSSEMDTGSELDGAGRGTQGAGGELGFSSGGRAAPEGVPDPELVERASRRRFSAAYKLSIVREADACSKPGEIGAALDRAFASGVPYLVNVITDPAVAYPRTTTGV